MAIAPTGALYKAFSFDGVSSRSYGAYLTGEGVYNAPERDVEMVSIPGRNGAFPFDQGRFNNVEITYQATIAAHTEQDFREAMSGLRNLLCSRKGYFRLEDEYHPDEYRMAVYKSGMEVEPVGCTQAEFSIVFDCKPQRYLKSGETEVTVSIYDPINNPTPFPASPLMEVWGYGGISINGKGIRIVDEQLGNIVLDSDLSFSFPFNGFGQTYTVDFELDTTRLNTGDSCMALSPDFTMELYSPTWSISDAYEDEQVMPGAIGWITHTDKTVSIEFLGEALSFAYKTEAVELCDDSFAIVYADSTHGIDTIGIALEYHYVTNKTLRLSITVSKSNSKNVDSGLQPKETLLSGKISRVTAVSTMSVLGNPTYIDWDIGEAYKMVGVTPVSLNRYIDLGANLPILAPGNNSIIYENTITSLKLIPRWWIV